MVALPLSPSRDDHAGTDIGAADLEVPATQPVDITPLENSPLASVFAPVQAFEDLPATADRNRPAKTPQAIQRWYSDGGPVATPTTGGL